MTTQEIIEVIKGLSVLELNDLVKACEEEFGVSAAAGVVVAAAGAGDGAAAEEKTVRMYEVQLLVLPPSSARMLNNMILFSLRFVNYYISTFMPFLQVFQT